MKLTVLGCWAPYPRAGGACSGYLVQAGSRNILLECGNGVMSNLQKYIDFRSLDAVVISHLHPDHYMDLFCLRHAVSGAMRTDGNLRPLSLYLPGEPEDTFGQISRFTDAFDIRPVESLPRVWQNGMEVFQTIIGDVRISFIQADHPLKTYSMVIACEGRLFYSADTKWSAHLVTAAEGVDLALCEASVAEQDRDYVSAGHLTAKQAGELAREAGVGQLVITHFWPEYTLNIIIKEAEEGFGRAVTAAAEGLQIQVEPFALLHAPSPKKV
ncbi:MBL fold metallo-hydrolase [Phosphitispora sp. TUW77]|uniref:MBL fold metallo-hydrolase n=1 Tax=Phosphitispora sp. TUW77 TaxID=3152361 RepID=UPI003AB15255